MIVKDLINACNDVDIKNEIHKFSPPNDRKRSWYRGCESILKKLRKIQPVETDTVLFFVPHWDTSLGDFSIEFLYEKLIRKGFRFHSEWDKVIETTYPDKESYVEAACALNIPLGCVFGEGEDEFSNWSLLLGSHVEETSVEKYGKSTVLASIVRHIAGYGYTERDIRKIMKENCEGEDCVDGEEEFILFPDDRDEKKLKQEYDYKEEDEAMGLPKGTTENQMRIHEKEYSFETLEFYRAVRDYYVRHFGSEKELTSQD